MTARSSALQAYDREHSKVLAEYQRREKDAPGSGDRWISGRTLILRRAREAEQTPSPQVTAGPADRSGPKLRDGDSGPPPASGQPLHARTREGRRRTLVDRLRGGAT